MGPGDTLRIENSALRLHFKHFCQHQLFTTFFTALIVINTVVLASERYRMPVDEIEFLAAVNYFLTLSFTFEVMFKLMAYTPGEFGGDAFNTFDFLARFFKLMNFSFKTRIPVSKTRNFAFEMMIL